MTSEAIGLLVAGDTAFQVLPGRLGMAQDPEGLIVVEGGHHPSSSLEAEVQVAFPAEALRVVAGGALAHSPVRLGAVGGHEVEGMESGRFDPVVALEAVALRVAGGAFRLTGHRLRPVGRGKACRVESTGAGPGSLDSSGPSLHRARDGQDRIRKVCKPSMAGQAGAPIMANRTVCGEIGCQGTMSSQKFG
jgi:hypothetical protein